VNRVIGSGNAAAPVWPVASIRSRDIGMLAAPEKKKTTASSTWATHNAVFTGSTPGAGDDIGNGWDYWLLGAPAGETGSAEWRWPADGVVCPLRSHHTLTAKIHTR
jgi:hypothetical protein